MNFSCGGCDNTWTGANTAHCSACHRTFSGPTLFDKHRQATTKARVWVRYMDSEGPFPEPKVVGRFVHPKDKTLSEAVRKAAIRVYMDRMQINKRNGAEVYGIETRDVQLPHGRCVDPVTLMRPLSDVEIELGAVGFTFDADSGFGRAAEDESNTEVPVLEFYGTSYEVTGGNGKRTDEVSVRTRAEMWRVYRLRDAQGDIIEREAWNAHA